MSSSYSLRSFLEHVIDVCSENKNKEADNDKPFVMLYSEDKYLSVFKQSLFRLVHSYDKIVKQLHFSDKNAIEKQLKDNMFNTAIIWNDASNNANIKKFASLADNDICRKTISLNELYKNDIPFENLIHSVVIFSETDDISFLEQRRLIRRGKESDIKNILNGFEYKQIKNMGLVRRMSIINIYDQVMADKHYFSEIFKNDAMFMECFF